VAGYGGSAQYIVLSYEDVCSKAVGSAVEVVKSFDTGNIANSIQIKNLPRISACADITSNDTHHERVVKYPFRERVVESMTNTFAILTNTIVICRNRSRRDKLVLFLAPGKDKYQYSDTKKNGLQFISHNFLFKWLQKLVTIFILTDTL
jgi:hypothetical protein